MMRAISLLQVHMIAFAAGFFLDLIIGDSRNIPHPIIWIGKLIDCFDRKLLWDMPDKEPDPEMRDRRRELIAGRLSAAAVLLITLAASAAVMYGAYRISLTAGACVEAVLTCYLLAQTSLRRESMKVYAGLAAHDIEAARQAVSMIVGRDTEVLDEEGITKAAVETVAENFSDGVFAPMLYTAIGGPVLGFGYKAINTMDSMIGYMNERYKWFGAAAARLDDIVNFIPSRLSALLLIAASAVGGRDYDAGRAYRIWMRDRRKHKSPNAAQTESAAAGALGIQLAGDAQYFGRIVKKEYIGDKTRDIEAYDIVRMNRLMSIASFMGFVLCLAFIALIALMIQRS